MRRFNYTRATDVNEVLKHLGQRSNGVILPLAGGTDLITLMKSHVLAPAELVDIKRLADLPNEIEFSERGLQLGALTTLSAIETDATIADHYPLLAQAAGLAATPQLRNMAAIGGNLLQRPRCWYFRNELFNCWLAGGENCPAHEGQNEFHALFGGGPCYAVHPSDLASALLALEANVQLRSVGGERMLSLAEFFALPTDERRRETTNEHNELILSVQIPSLPPNTRSVYLKAMDRKVWAFALVGVAAVVRLEADRIADVRLVLTGVAPIPWRVPAAEQLLLGQTPDETLFAQAAAKALERAEMLEHNAYKVPLAQNLIRQALMRLTIERT